MQFFCPKTRTLLHQEGDQFVGNEAELKITCIDSVYVCANVHDQSLKQYYDDLYDSELGDKWVQGLDRQSAAKRILEKISLSYRRERFFKKHLSGDDNMILDIACGVGRDYLGTYGTVVGVDLSHKALKVAANRYDYAVQTGVDTLPFPDNTFDYVISSDFFGHVENGPEKDVIISEILRVLKPGGKTIHVIETDSTNIWFRTAHKDPELFQKYFVEEIGGHIGLEMPSDVVNRFKNIGFDIAVVKKIWGLIWPVQDYARMMQGFSHLSPLAKFASSLSKILGKNQIVRSILNVVLNPINSLIEAVTPLNHGQGLMLVAQKPSYMNREIQKETYQFSSDSTGTHMKIVNQVQKKSKVLDVGCAAGYLGKYLIDKKQCRVDGIEYDTSSAEKARKQGYQNVHVGDAVEVLSSLPVHDYDVLIAADILEHLVEPEKALRLMKAHLNNNGVLIVSMPNIAHYSIRIKLLFGKWNMTETGILDRTHLRFYTKRTMESLFEDNGWDIESWQARGDVERWFAKLKLFSLGRLIQRNLSTVLAVQYIYTLKKTER